MVILDSGMGGLSICAHLVNRLQRRCPFEQVRMTYFNAWPEEARGYNMLPTWAERIRVFDAALAGVRAFDPDVLLIACNTLSIFYPHTIFSRSAAFPVVGIVDFGVGMIRAAMDEMPGSQVIILGTLTTIGSAIHRDSLISHGIDGRRIVSQACDQLATAIESGPDSPRVRAMIDDFAVQAAAKLLYPDKPVLAAFCCTHYGYSQARFKTSLDEAVGGDIRILNPNTAMADHVLGMIDSGSGSAGDIELEVVSRIRWSETKRSAIAGALETVSPLTAQALMDYRYDAKLFSF
jgi:glutamate racemase